MNLRNNPTTKMRLLAIGFLYFFGGCPMHLVMAEQGGTMTRVNFSPFTGSNADTESEVKPTAKPTTIPPTISPAPTVSMQPTGPPSVSLAPTGTPTESPAPSPSPSEAPTNFPTPPTQAPTASPTESPATKPAPSPSPSEAPTDKPSDAPSVSPTLAPTISPAPTTSPSVSPTDSPSKTPTDAPSLTPTTSPQPSSQPTVSPAPSKAPTKSPSASPSDSPTDAPSDSPSDSPSKAPSLSPAPTTSQPSSVPSSTPTDEAFKTKSGITNVFLLDIDREMTDTAMRQFEVTTLQFIRDTQTATPNFTVSLLAVTVLTQEVVYPEPEQAEDGAENNASTVGLQVAFRTVGVVTEGSAPRDLDFTSVTDAGFEHYYGEYLYRLSISDSFFEPLSKHVDTTTLLPLPEQAEPSEGEDPHSQSQFVVAVLFASFALVLAVSGSVFAVRKHLRKESEKLQRLEYPAHGTKTMSDDPDYEEQEDRARRYDCEELSDLSATQAESKHQTQRIATTTRSLQLDIDDEGIEMEDIGLTPISVPHVNAFSSAHKPPRVPVSPDAMERGGRVSDYGNGTGVFMDLKKRASFGFGVKKWLTPRRQSSPKTTSKIDLNDPPEVEITFEANDEKPANKNRQSMDPDAVKASTRNAAGIITDEQMTHDELRTKSEASNSKRKSSSRDGNNFGVPVSFFGRSSDNRSDATSGNMDSMIGGSTASSFLRMGRKSNDFTGRESTQSNIGTRMSEQEANTYKFGSTSGRNTIANNENSKPGNAFSLNEENLAVLRTNSNDNVEASVAGLSDFEMKRAMFEGSPVSQIFASKIARESRNVDASTKSIELVLNTHDGQDSSGTEREVKRTKTFEADSVYSEQSELDLNELGIETMLGAIPPAYDNGTPASRNSSFVGHEYGSRPIAFYPPSSIGAPSEGLSMKSGRKSDATLGARALAAEEAKRRISLNTAIKQGDTYDVFAPAGPIGIVVDTSKLGPAVHSLKSTSPMLGLINPGDLIIALDDEDTRNMTAASLTRLMAKKSRQRERKITLLAPNGF